MRLPQGDEDVAFCAETQTSFIRKGSDAHHLISTFFRRPGEPFRAGLDRFVSLMVAHKRARPHETYQQCFQRILGDLRA